LASRAEARRRGDFEIVVGSDVRNVRLASGRLAEILADVEYHTFRDADHYVSMSQPARFNKVLRGSWTDAAPTALGDHTTT
jgi:pimeloyl-ACP methyl ester carboxylesterase